MTTIIISHNLYFHAIFRFCISFTLKLWKWHSTLVLARVWMSNLEGKCLHKQELLCVKIKNYCILKQHRPLFWTHHPITFQIYQLVHCWFKGVCPLRYLDFIYPIGLWNLQPLSRKHQHVTPFESCLVNYWALLTAKNRTPSLFSSRAVS